MKVKPATLRGMCHPTVIHDNAIAISLAPSPLWLPSRRTLGAAGRRGLGLDEDASRASSSSSRRLASAFLAAASALLRSSSSFLAAALLLLGPASAPSKYHSEIAAFA